MGERKAVRLLVYLSIVGLFLACSGNRVVVADKSVPKNQDLTEAMADSFWELRSDSAFANRALNAYIQLVEGNPTSLILSSKLSHAFYYQAQYLTTQTVRRDSLFMRGYETSQSILNKDEDYRNLLFSTGDESMAIRGLDEQSIDALYWGMANYGQWLSTKGSLVRLGQRNLLWTTLEHVRDLDSTFYFGAYYRFKGPLLARDPAFQDDTLAIRKAFEKAIEIAPDYLGNYTLMAAYLCPLTGDKELFYQLMTKVVTARPEPSLPYYSENIYEKKIAERLMIKAEKESWF